MKNKGEEVAKEKGIMIVRVRAMTTSQQTEVMPLLTQNIDHQINP
jgi:hypothetical protein